jgi:hypothetical protein
MPTVSDVRLELQLPASAISDDAITYVISKVTSGDLNLVCAEVLRLVLRKYRGRFYIWVGKTREQVNPGEIRALIREYVARAATAGHADDGIADPPPFFTREGI